VHRLLLAFSCGAFDFAVHFTMDRVKASPNMLGQFKALSGREAFMATTDLGFPAMTELDHAQQEVSRAALTGNKLFWLAVGFDQMIHHLTHYAIIAFLVTR
jgi:hypothetical protein